MDSPEKCIVVEKRVTKTGRYDKEKTARQKKSQLDTMMEIFMKMRRKERRELGREKSETGKQQLLQR